MSYTTRIELIIINDLVSWNLERDIFLYYTFKPRVFKYLSISSSIYIFYSMISLPGIERLKRNYAIIFTNDVFRLTMNFSQCEEQHSNNFNNLTGWANLLIIKYCYIISYLGSIYLFYNILQSFYQDVYFTITV